MMYVIIAVAAILVIGGFVFNYKRSKKINENGIETDAVVSRIKETEGEDAEGHRSVEYTYYVKYQNEAGAVVEAKLGNPPRFLMEGQQLRIKYLPEKPKYALMVK